MSSLVLSPSSRQLDSPIQSDCSSSPGRIRYVIYNILRDIFYHFRVPRHTFSILIICNETCFRIAGRNAGTRYTRTIHSIFALHFISIFRFCIFRWFRHSHFAIYRTFSTRSFAFSTPGMRLRKYVRCFFVTDRKK